MWQWEKEYFSYVEFEKPFIFYFMHSPSQRCLKTFSRIFWNFCCGFLLRKIENNLAFIRNRFIFRSSPWISHRTYPYAYLKNCLISFPDFYKTSEFTSFYIVWPIILRENHVPINCPLSRNFIYFYFYYFWFHQPYTPAMHTNQNKKIRCAHAQNFCFYGAQSIRNAAETYNIFFSRIFGCAKYGKMM